MAESAGSFRRHRLIVRLSSRSESPGHRAAHAAFALARDRTLQAGSASTTAPAAMRTWRTSDRACASYSTGSRVLSLKAEESKSCPRKTFSTAREAWKFLRSSFACQRGNPHRLSASRGGRLGDHFSGGREQTFAPMPRIHRSRHRYQHRSKIGR